jgi:hypothetical protein
MKDFAECHSVLDKEKSPSRRQVMATEPVPSAQRVTHGKGPLYAECLLYWHSAKKLPVGPFTSSVAKRIRWNSTKATFFPSVQLNSTRQRDHPRACFVSSFAECTRRHSTKLASLPSAKATTLGKEALPVPRCAFFGVLWPWHSAKYLFAESYTLQSDQNTPF